MKLPTTPKLPNTLLNSLDELRLKLEECCVVEFDASWQLIARHGNVSRFALHDLADADLSQLFQALCMGLPRTRGAELKHVGLPNGVTVDLRLYSSKLSVFVLLVDVREEVEKARNWQQNAQETELLSYEKSRELRKTRTRGQTLKSQNIELRRNLWLAHAAHDLLLIQLTAHVRADQTALLELLSHAREPLQKQSAGSLGELIDMLRLCVADRIDIAARNPQQSALHSTLRATSALLPLLVFAHARNLNANASLNLSADAHALKAELTTSGSDLNSVESALLWERLLPDRDLSKSEMALLLTADRLDDFGGRTTRSFNAGAGNGELKLTLSLPLEKPVIPEQTRVQIAVGALFWVLSQRDEQLFAVRQFIQKRGFQMQQHFDTEAMLKRLIAHPPQVIIADASDAAAVKFVFRARAEGYVGRTLALGSLNASAAIKAVFDAQCEQLSESGIAEALGLG